MGNIKDKLERVAGLVESGDALERDLALELLREIYSKVKFGAITEATVVAEVEAKAAAFSVDETALEGEDCLVAEQETGIVPEPAQEPEPEIVPEPEQETEPEVEPEPEPEPEPPVIPRRVAPEVIKSLYGSESEPATPAPRAPSPEEGNFPRIEPEPVAPASEPAPKHTLGDAIAPKKTLGETLRQGERDMASHVAATQAAGRPGLKRSIGLNDRFLMIRDMFDGDADAFDRAITQLDAFTDLDEAVIWIHDNFDWSADSRGATLLVGLLERKLGH